VKNACGHSSVDICLTAALISLKLVVKKKKRKEKELSRWASDECLFQGL